MKAFVVILALALISGSQAQEDNQDVALSTFIQATMSELQANIRDNLQTEKLGPVMERVWQDLTNIYRPIQELGNKLHGAVIGASDRLQELQIVTEQSADDVWNRVGPYTRKLKKRLNKDGMEITKRVDIYLNELQSYTSDHMESVKSRLVPYFAHVRDNAEANISTLNRLLETGTEDLKGQMQENAAYIQQQLEGKMEELSTWFEPFTSRMRDTLQSLQI